MLTRLRLEQLRQLLLAHRIRQVADEERGAGRVVAGDGAAAHRHRPRATVVGARPGARLEAGALAAAPLRRPVVAGEPAGGGARTGYAVSCLCATLASLTGINNIIF